jgi:hypothetical protein
LSRFVAYFALAAATVAAYFSVPFWGFVLASVCSLGFVVLKEWLRRRPASQTLSRLVLAAYFITGSTALGTLFAGLPAPAFWVVSAVLPAWQAQRLIARGDREQAVGMLGVALGVYAWVLVVALWLPILLSYR